MGLFYTSIEDSDVDSSENLIANEKSQKTKYKPARKCSSQLVLALNGVFLLFNLILVGALYRGQPLEFRDVEKSPAAESIKWETKYFGLGGHNSPYFGKPRKSLQVLWRDLKKYADIIVSEEYMRKLGRVKEGVKLPDGTGYLATLNVYHDIHCIEQVYRWINKDIYIPNITEKENVDQIDHLYHCLEGLRQSVMCSADLSVITYRWGTQQSTPLANWESKHTCKNWEAVEDWASKNQVSDKFREPGWLNHPTLGPAYGNTSRLGVVNYTPLI